MANSADPDQLASEANIWIYTVCKGRVYRGSAELGLYIVPWFVCVEVLRPSQLNRVMSSTVSLPNHTFTGQA